jgi:hypothetical protein
MLFAHPGTYTNTIAPTISIAAAVARVGQIGIGFEWGARRRGEDERIIRAVPE